MDNRVLILVNESLFIKPTAVWRVVYKDKKGEFVKVNKQKYYLHDLEKKGDFEYVIK